MGFSVALIINASDVSQILMNLPSNPLRKANNTSLTLQLEKGEQRTWELPATAGNSEAETSLDLQVPGLPKPALTLSNYILLMTEVPRICRLPHISVTVACAQHPPRAGSCACSQSREHVAQLSAPAALPSSVRASVTSICLTPAFLFLCIKWNYSPKLLREKTESNLSLNSNKSQEAYICNLGSLKCLNLDLRPQCLLLPIMEDTIQPPAAQQN